MNKRSLLAFALFFMFLIHIAWADRKAALESNSIYEDFLKLSSKEQDEKLDVAYHTSGNKVLDVDKSYSDAQKKFVKKSFDVMSKTMADHRSEIADCVKTRLSNNALEEGSFDSKSNLFTFKNINSRRADQKKGRLTSDELMIGLINPAGYRLKIIQIPDGGTAMTGLRQTPEGFIIGLGVQDKFLQPQKNGNTKKFWDYALSGSQGNSDLTSTDRLKAVTDETFLAGVMAHEMAHNYGLDHSDMGSSDYTYVGEMGYCVTLVARRNSVLQKLESQSRPSSRPISAPAAGASGASTDQ